jgi:hypothetical protein
MQMYIQWGSLPPVPLLVSFEFNVRDGYVVASTSAMCCAPLKCQYISKTYLAKQMSIRQASITAAAAVKQRTG